MGPYGECPRLIFQRVSGKMPFEEIVQMSQPAGECFFFFFFQSLAEIDK